MPLKEFIDYPIDEVVVSPLWTPNGIGIGQCSTQAYNYQSQGEPWREHWAITECCTARVVLDREPPNELWPWKCDQCGKALTQPVGAKNPGTSASSYADGRELDVREWVSWWTGLDIERINVEVEK